MMRKLPLVAGAVVALAISFSRDAAACSCATPGPPCQSAWSSDAVFSGTVVSIEQIDHETLGAPNKSMLVKFSVQRGFINAPAGVVEIVTGMGGGDCGYPFKSGGQYLVYASKSFSSSQLTASICSRTRPLADAAEDVRYLSTVGPGAAGGRVFGRITELRRDPAEDSVVDYGPVEGIVVSVRGAAFARDVVTDADGRFEIAHLAVGKLTFSVSLPFGFEPWRGDTEVDIRDPRACAQIDVPIQQFARALGSVVDAAGRPVKGVAVDAVAAELAGFDPPPYQYPVRTDEHGAFEFERLPPGAYVFGINLTKSPMTPRHGSPLFFPGTRVAREAAVIELKAGDSRDVGVIKLPQ